MTEPTAEQRAATAGIFKNIVEVLKHGMFFGHSAGYVAESIAFLEANIKAMSVDPAGEAVPAPLAAVPPEEHDPA